MPPRRVLVTGGAGFIGSHLVDALLERGDSVVVLDNFNDFYSPATKRLNVASHANRPDFVLIEGDIRDADDVKRTFDEGPFDAVVHLAAMAGVQPSIKQPTLYASVNVMGTQVLTEELLRSSPKARLVFGSSSSVYGSRSGERFVETDRVDQPLSPYAATKAANEAQLYALHHTAKLQVVCLRLFTVIGPRQRPDLAIHKFCRAVDAGAEIEVYGDGSSKRDYTFVGDIVSGITAAMEFSFGGYEIMNLGRSEPVILIDMIRMIEEALGKQAKLVYKPFQVGDMPYTYADISKAQQLLGYAPTTPLSQGIKRFVAWYKQEQLRASQKTPSTSNSTNLTPN